ncbi:MULTISPECIES: tetratricopeptide repeat protein [Clostridium]|uniref:tetratricopeptide repeat protein n=1 Tax=Clostridium TaxID=1485 RepID=UPI00069D3378|nr:MULTISPECIES: tetratricopeptide repeat protein [Clostridium]KOF57251.1 hypothetical protein AGR56_12395 [Clostridium sp. DMHC 10]MCD2348136.1 tetratricopeptide repeat protein [Clostridium guangxiense]
MLNNKLLTNVFAIAIGVLVFIFINRLLGIVIIGAFIIAIGLPIVFMFLGNSAYGAGQMDRAIKYYKMAANNIFASIKVKIAYSYIAIKNGYVDEAEEVLQKYKGTKMGVQDEIRYVSTYGIVLWKKGKIDEAVEMVFKVYEKYKTTAVYENLGYFLILKGDYDKAISFNEEAYEYSDSDAGILDNLALSYYLKGNHEKSAEIYEKLMKMNPDFVTAYYYYALVLIEKKDYENALDNLKKAANCKFSFISLIQKEEIEEKIKQVEKLTQNE